MSEVGAPVIQCRQCGWQPRTGDRVCEQCSALLAAPPEIGRAAGRGRRVAGALIDFIIAAIPSIIAGVIWGADAADTPQLPDGTVNQDLLPDFTPVVIAGIAGFVLWSLIVLALARRRQSPGKAMLGMMVVRIDGEPVSPGLFVARQIGWWLVFSVIGWITAIPDGSDRFAGLGFAGALILLVDVGMLLFSRNRQAVHDKLFKTIVVSTGPSGVPLSMSGTEPAPAPPLSEPPSEPPSEARSYDEPASPMPPPPVDEDPALGKTIEPQPAAPEAPPPDRAPRGLRPELQQQLEELERLRDYLTPQQYERRRRSILGIADPDDEDA